eukprot:g19282.t1
MLCDHEDGAPDPDPRTHPDCPRECSGAWGDWSSCQKRTGKVGDEWTRMRKFEIQVHDKKAPCEAKDYDIESCSPCVGHWEEWNKECDFDGETKTRFYEVVSPAHMQGTGCNWPAGKWKC